MACNIVNALILVSEKAANIARICRKEKHLLSLLVQEKKEDEKNPRFVHDFKTFADVLVQEVVKYEVGRKFPSLSGFIYGEESNEFLCGEETVFVKVQKTQSETEKLLFKILKDYTAATLLAKEVHRDINISNIQHDDFVLPENVGIWIDPIDATAEYIRGDTKIVHKRLYGGLPCVSVLIGVFDRNTGIPIIGIINQPFHKKEENSWTGRYVYGLSLDTYNVTGPEKYPECSDKVIAVSSSENEEIKAVFRESGYTVVEIPGAGYKMLSVITGEISAYILSQPTTFFWDTCACQAILKSLGGDVLDFTTLEPLNCKGGKTVNEYCNIGGIIAYKNSSLRNEIIILLGSLRKH